MDEAATKTCSSCGTEKPLTPEFFYWRKETKSFRAQCRECKVQLATKYRRSPAGREARKALYRRHKLAGLSARWSREFRKNRRELYTASKKKYYLKNKEKIRKKSQKYYRSLDREKLRERQRRWYAARQKNPENVVRSRIRSRFKRMLRSAGGKSLARMEKILGYNKHELKQHIERQFRRGMTWDKFLSGKIEIDHIIPVSKFKVDNDRDFKACWSLANLRPLWAKQNRRKRATRLHLL